MINKMTSKQARIAHDRLLLETTERCLKEPFFDECGNLHASPFLAFKPLLTQAPKPVKLIKARKCYICKTRFQAVHQFYHQLCPNCAAENYAKRSDSADLSTYHALVTGGRIKIGFEIALMLLRAGATVLITTRFAHNALQRFQAQADYPQWSKRLLIYGIDLRYLDNVQQFINTVLAQLPKLDILINNAAQTITRPADYYQPLIQEEQTCLPTTEAILKTLTHVGGTISSELVQRRDEFNEPLDTRTKNSWRETLATVNTRELVETQVVNAIVPFMLSSQLKPLMLRSKQARFIVNVSAMEGQFNRQHKTHFHPHTNMAKAALNMLTRTSAMDYVREQIYMNSVDTGWVTDEDAFTVRRLHRIRGQVPPLDCIDGAARVLAPIWDGLRGKLYYGQFMKDYRSTQW